MTLQRTFTRFATIGLLAFTLAGCATHYDRKTNNTLMGAGLGAATGAVFSGGDPLYAIGGAAAGGLLGNILTEDRSANRSRNWDRGRNYSPSRNYARETKRRPSNNRQNRRHR